MAVCRGLFVGAGLWCTLLPAVAADRVTGHLDLPPAVLAQLGPGGTITTLFDVPVGTVQADGRFSALPGVADDIDILSVRGPASQETVAMGYADGTHYTLGVEGTALAMLYLLTPSNALLDAAGKRAFFSAARNHPHFSVLTQQVRRHMAAQRGVMQTGDAALVAALRTIQKALPDAAQPSGPPGAAPSPDVAGLPPGL